MKQGHIGKVLEEAFFCIDRRPVWEWASDNIELPLSYSIPGRFKIARSRHLQAIFAALSDPKIRTVNVLKPTQTGGTLISDIFVPFVLANHPGPVLWNFPTDQLAEQHAEARAMPVIRGCKTLSALMPNDRHKKRKMEILFRNGVPLYIQGSAISGLQSKSIRYLINDECWDWETGRLGEAEARVGAFKRFGLSKVLNISQGGTVGDDWHNLTEDAMRYDWHVPCPHCQQYQPLNIVTKQDKTETVHMQFDESRCWFVCIQCGQRIEDSPGLRDGFNRAGRYELTKPGNPSAATFHWTAWCWSPWDDLLTDYKKALAQKKAGNLMPLKEFIQKKLAEFWKEDAELEPLDIKPAVFDQPTFTDEKFRFLTVDTQQHYFYAIVRGWAPDGSSCLNAYGKLFSFEEIDSYAKAKGVKPHCVLIDARYNTVEVYKACAKYGWTALMGEDREKFEHPGKDGKRLYRPYSTMKKGDPMIGQRTQDYARSYCPMFLWSNPTIKDTLQTLKEGRGAKWMVPPNVSQDYLDQLNSERKVEDTDRNGYRRTIWKKLSHRDNHYWDCECMQLVAAFMAGAFGD